MPSTIMNTCHQLPRTATIATLVLFFTGMLWFQSASSAGSRGIECRPSIPSSCTGSSNNSADAAQQLQQGMQILEAITGAMSSSRPSTATLEDTYSAASSNHTNCPQDFSSLRPLTYSLPHATRVEIEQALGWSISRIKSTEGLGQAIRNTKENIRYLQEGLNVGDTNNPTAARQTIRIYTGMVEILECNQRGPSTTQQTRQPPPPSHGLPSSNAPSQDKKLAECVQQNFSSYSNGQFALANTCNYAINIKYMFSVSAPFSGTYTTLQPKGHTFMRGNSEELVVFSYCPTPKVPQTLQGGCI